MRSRIRPTTLRMTMALIARIGYAEARERGDCSYHSLIPLLESTRDAGPGLCSGPDFFGDNPLVVIGRMDSAVAEATAALGLRAALNLVEIE